MQKEINRLYRSDCANVIVWIFLLWLVVTFVFLHSAGAFKVYQVRLIAMGAALAALIFGTSALVAVLSHLKKNCRELYTEELKNLQLMKQAQKAGE